MYHCIYLQFYYNFLNRDLLGVMKISSNIVNYSDISSKWLYRLISFFKFSNYVLKIYLQFPQSIDVLKMQY